MKKKEIAILDEMWAQFIKNKAKYVCEHCGIRGIRMEAAHVVGRRHRATRWGTIISGSFDLCGHCLCHNCHQQYDEHGPKEEYIILKTIGVVRKALIQQAAHSLVAKNQFFEDIREILQIEEERWKVQNM